MINSVAEISQAAKKLGLITGNEQRGSQICDSLEYVKKSLLFNRNKALTAIALVSTEPLFAFGKGSLMDQMMNYSKIDNLIDTSFIGAYPELDEEYILRKDPMVLLIPESVLIVDFFNLHSNLRALSAYKNHKI